MGKLILRTDVKPNEKGENPIYLQYTVDGHVAKAATGIFVTKKDWNEKLQQIRATYPNATLLNNLLAKKKTDVDSAILNFPDYKRLTIQVERKMLVGESPEDTGYDVDFIDLVLEQNDVRYKTERIGISVHDNVVSAMNGFQQFLRVKSGCESVNCSEVTEKLIDEYIIWRKDFRGNDNASINKTLTPIFKTAQYAARRGYMQHEVADAICEKYLSTSAKRLDEEDDTDVKYLTEEQMNEFVRLSKEVKYPRTKDYMDMFLFSVNAWGLRFSDLLTLRWDNIDMENKLLRKTIYKTGRKHEIRLNEGAMEILNRWQGRYKRFVFGLLSDNFGLNDEAELKKQRLYRNRPILQSLNTVGYKLGLDFRLTMHVARHTFAVLALNRKVDVHTH